MSGLPHGRGRWKPNRAGIRNIWEYDEQVFEFADGRMILRGPNGSGKSNVLALIFPFLFDGTMSVAAMDPFAGGRSMKSLLLGVLRDDTRSGFRHDQRLGYVWLEFARDGSHGDEHLTVGCGARARADGDARSWFFVTRQRVGVDLDLAPGDTPLTRGRLIEEIGADAVHDGADEHRQVVARDLLGIDAEQLGKLNGLIRALRRPQLAGKLNVEELSAVLSSGLPAVAPSALDDIAASLDDLERVQHELVAVHDALATVDAFLPTYRTYLAGEARRRAAGVTECDRTLAAERSELTRLEKRSEQLADRDRSLRAQRTTTLSQRAQAVAEHDALKDSERFRGAQELEQEQAHAVSLTSSAEAAGRRHTEASTEADRQERRAEETAGQAQRAAAEADRLLRDTMDRADRVRATWSLDVDAQGDPLQLRSAVNVMVRERRAAVAALRQASSAFNAAIQRHRDAEAARSKADEALDRAAGDMRERTEEHDQAWRDLDLRVADWLHGVPGLDGEATAAVASLVTLVVDGHQLELGERYRLATSGYRDDRRDERSRIDRAIQEQQDQQHDLQRERDAVSAEVDPGPAPAPWRTEDRSGRPGAPLWACCDFAADADLTPAEQAQLEAAIDAAGLLDAWLQPDGDLSGLDAWLRPSAERGPDDAPGRTLASVLSVDLPHGSELTHEYVKEVLSSIRLGHIGVAVATDGRFALGPLVGRASKPAAEFIGATARAQRRARRLAELDASLARVDAELRRLAEERRRVDRELAALEAAADRAPDTRPLSDATARVRSAGQRHRAAQDRADEAASAEAEQAAAAVAAGAERDRVADRLAVPSNDDDLELFAQHVEDLGDTGREAAQIRAQAIERAARAAEQQQDAASARATATARADEADTAEREALAQQRRVDTLRRRLGPDVGAVFDELAALRGRIDEFDVDIEALGSELEGNKEAIGEANAAIGSTRQQILAAEGALRSAEARLPVLRGHEVLAVLGIPDDDLPLEPVAFAGGLADQLGGPPDDKDHDQAKRAVDRAQKQLLDDLHHGYAPAIVHDDDLILVEVTSDDRSVFGLAELRSRLERQATEMAQHLTDSDKEIFERHLLNRVSHELRRLLGEADEFVDGVNEALAGTKTASGLQVELRWVASGDDAETRRALGLLRRDTDQMGDDDRAALRRFFDLAIKRQRAEDPDAGYRSNLEQVVDYRRWHRFEPYLVGPDGRARLTRERFRGLSGGEQAVALHLPLFAAAAAHYDRADQSAPRLIALDEAFAGIDEEMRGELLGLTVAFDLDVLLTGHELSGTYAEVPAIAVHDLLRRPPLEGVSVLTLRWDGQNLAEGPVEAPPATARPSSMPPTGLFADEPNQ